MPHVIEPLSQTPLFVNDGQLDPQQVGSLRPSLPNEPLDILRQRYKEDGYLFLKGVLPREDVLEMRENYFRFLAPSGVLAPGTAPVQGIFDASKDKSQYPGMITVI